MSEISLKGKSVLVTGGAGFIGSHVVDRIILEKPSSLIVVDNFFLGKETNLRDAKKKYSGLRIEDLDASNYDAMKKVLEAGGVEVVFNLAVVPLPVSLNRPRWAFEQNVGITATMCELAREDVFKTLVHFSSSEAYGTSDYAPMDEKHPSYCTTAYAASKAASDQLVFSYCESFGIDASIIRPFNNYGPRQNDGSYAGVVPITIKRVLRGEAPVIYGDGKQTRDYLFVTDTADAAVKAYETKSTRKKALNIASGSETSIEMLVHIIAQQLGYSGDVVYKEERPGDVRRHIANTFLAEDLLGFRPTLDLKEGLKITIDWYRKELAKSVT